MTGDVATRERDERGERKEDEERACTEGGGVEINADGDIIMLTVTKQKAMDEIGMQILHTHTQARCETGLRLWRTQMDWLVVMRGGILMQTEENLRVVAWCE